MAKRIESLFMDEHSPSFEPYGKSVAKTLLQLHPSRLQVSLPLRKPRYGLSGCRRGLGDDRD